MFLQSSGQGLEYSDLENNGKGLQSDNQVDIWWDPLMSQICVFSLPLLCHLGIDDIMRLYSWASRCSGKLHSHVGSISWAWLSGFLLLPDSFPSSNWRLFVCVCVAFDSYTKWIFFASYTNFWAIKNSYTSIFLNYDGPLLIIYIKRENHLPTWRNKTVSCLVLSTFCGPMNCNPLGSSVHGMLQAGILEWAAIPFSRGSFHRRDWTHVSWIAARFFTIWMARKWIKRGNQLPIDIPQ